MLNEKWGWFDAIASIFCFVGVLFVAKPKFLFGGESVRMILVIDHRAFKLDIC
jgi:singapore isolate B (sub-type 7) whole genome shotgun sequence assembly, scaffold_2